MVKILQGVDRAFNPGFDPIAQTIHELETAEVGDVVFAARDSAAKIFRNMEWMGLDAERPSTEMRIVRKRKSVLSSFVPKTKPYDAILARMNVLNIAHQRRKEYCDSMVCLDDEVYTFKRGEEIATKYPWTHMEAGYYFHYDYKSQRDSQVFFTIARHAAKRHDFEIAFVPTATTDSLGYYKPRFRVVCVLTELSHWKKELLKSQGVNQPDLILGLRKYSTTEIRERKVRLLRALTRVGYTREEAWRLWVQSPLYAEAQTGARRGRPRLPDPPRYLPSLDDAPPEASNTTEEFSPAAEEQVDITTDGGYNRAEIMKRRIAALFEEDEG